MRDDEDEEYGSVAKTIHRSHVARAFKSLKEICCCCAGKLLLVDSPNFDGCRYMIYIAHIDPSRIIAVNKNGALTVPKDVAGITFIGRDVYDLLPSELAGVGVAWLDTCQMGIPRHRSEFSTSLAAFADVPYVCEVHVLNWSFFMPEARRQIVDVKYKERHEMGERKAFHTRVDPYWGVNSQMLFVSSYLKGWAVEPVYMHAPLKRSITAAPAAPAAPAGRHKRPRGAPKKGTAWHDVIGKFVPKKGVTVKVAWHIKGRAKTKNFTGVVTRVDERGCTVLYPDQEFLHRWGTKTCLSLYDWVVVAVA